jgi:hypothetical protein
MIRTLSITPLLLLAAASTALADLPDPMRSRCGLSGQPATPCQWRSRASGDADRLTLNVTLRGPFDDPVPGCSTSVTLHGDTLCDCAGSLVRTGISDAGGVLRFAYGCLGGRGAATLDVTAHCAGDLGVCSTGFVFTSPDLDATCNGTPGPTIGGNVSLIDLGIWAGGLPPTYSMAADFNCDGTVDVADLAFFASGLGTSCLDCP